MDKRHRVYRTAVLFFFLLNIVNTYFLTVKELNRYIAPFRHTVSGEINALIGNASVLLIVVLILFYAFRNGKSRLLSLFVVSLILNLFVFAFTIFNLYFGTAFAAPSLVIFKNPGGGIAAGIILEVLLELVTYYRIVLFIPAIALFVLYLIGKPRELKTIRFRPRIKRYTIVLILAMLVLMGSLIVYSNDYQRTLPVDSVKSTYAIQNFGVYPFYLFQLLGEDLGLDIKDQLDIEGEEELARAYQEINRNRPSYVNSLDGKTYGNRLTVDQAVDLEIDLASFDGESLHGIFKGKNLVLVHLESINYFLFDIMPLSERLEFMNRLLEQSFVFENFYTTVGMGVSSDAELSVLTGLYPTGDETLYWDYNEIPYEITSLVDYFGDEDYYREALHGDRETFYNRRVVYDELYGFDRFYALEDWVEDGYVIEDGYLYDQDEGLIHHSPWISDYHLADTVNDVARRADQPYMLFPVTMMPHTPYDYDPNGLRTDLYPEWTNGISRLTLKYINYLDYIDSTLQRLFIDEQGMNRTLDDTVYLFYSDHGSGLKNGDLEVFYDREIPDMEMRRMLQHTLAFMYVPKESVIDYGDYVLNEGALIGKQPRVRSNIDLYRTTIELFDLPVGSDFYQGAHGFSREPTIAIDNRLFDVVTDDVFFSMRNPDHAFPEDAVIDEAFYQEVMRIKLLGDLMVSTADFQNQVNEALRKVYGDSH
ncbi:MAG: LTA synthase family protein [Acholeplasmataceae bacterium]